MGDKSEAKTLKVEAIKLTVHIDPKGRSVVNGIVRIGQSTRLLRLELPQHASAVLLGACETVIDMCKPGQMSELVHNSSSLVEESDWMFKHEHPTPPPVSKESRPNAEWLEFDYRFPEMEPILEPCNCLQCLKLRLLSLFG